MFLPKRKANEEWLGVVIAVPEPYATRISRIRAKFGSQQDRLVVPHITLVPPISVAIDLREAVLTHLQSIADKFSPFQVSLCGLGSFHPISPVHFLEVTEGANSCAELAASINDGPLSYQPRFPYHPHVTLAQGALGDRVKHIQELETELSHTCQTSWLVSGFRLDRVDESGNYSSMALFHFA